ncbi:uncharacterized protein DUF955 [Lentzea atacamensis]|uniref:Uncharacterized protein DUF955 n=1 Tax=Lentzea atacamensis TaxID=531938 RepID=A0ABX9DWF3_9PSEU|nr:ImmA/IrrE family metallo-endopeptidase [Lentzea atacamensis]RAS59487.1 uncharacterized protein DUF955 [Lentzea atacamensis]
MSDSPALTADKPTAPAPARRRSRKRESSAARDEVVEAMKARLDAAIAALGNEEKWIETLDLVAQFGARYSLGNQLLILLACQARGFAPTFVQSFSAWKAQATHDPAVCKGAKLKYCGCDLNVPQRPAGSDPDAAFGIPIWRPRKRKLTKEECDKHEADTGKKIARDAHGRSLNQVLVGFKPAYVFDASQLKRPQDAEIPAPLAVRRRIKVHGARPELLTGDDTTGALADVIALIEASGMAFKYVDPATLGGANGRTDGRTVWVRNDVSDAQKVKTAVHELAHKLCGHVDPDYGYARHRGKAETQAESVAYIVCGALGLDTGKYSAPYVNSWAEGDVQVIQAAAETVLRVSKQILAALDPAELSDAEDELADEFPAAA